MCVCACVCKCVCVVTMVIVDDSTKECFMHCCGENKALFCTLFCYLPSEPNTRSGSREWRCDLKIFSLWNVLVRSLKRVMRRRGNEEGMGREWGE